VLSSAIVVNANLPHQIVMKLTRFQDFNGDGRAEYLWVADDGSVTAFLNLGSASAEEGTQGAEINWLPQGVIATGVGAMRQEVQFAVASLTPSKRDRELIMHIQDLNGDGRAEYLWVHQNSSIEAWLNLGGPNDGPNAAQVAWLYQGFIATGIGAPGSSISFAVRLSLPTFAPFEQFLGVARVQNHSICALG
jgi:hypothetical protein